MAERKVVKQIQGMIDEADQRRQLGRVQLTKAEHFNINRPDLATIDPDHDPSGRRKDTGSKEVRPIFLEWNYEAFNHDRGAFYNPDPLNWKIGPRHERKRGTFISDSRGNFLHTINIGNNANVKYHVVIDISAAVTHKIRLESLGLTSFGVYIKEIGALSHIKQYTSGFANAHNPTTAIPLNFPTAGRYIITIYAYQQVQNPAVGGIRTTLSGDLSSISSAPAATGPPDIVVNFNTNAGGGTPSGGKSEFVDGANGPTLANIIYWDRIKQDAIDEAATDFDIAGYRLLNIRFETLDYTVVSGWGTDGFTVTGDKHADFPIGLDFKTFALPWDEHKVSGTFYLPATETDSGNAETLIITSGTGAPTGSEFIQVEQSLFVQDIPYDTQTGPVVSGAHLGVQVGETYQYEVMLYDRGGNVFPRTEAISFTTGDDITAPGKVTGVTSGGGNKRIMLGWINPSDTDIKGFNIWEVENPVLGTDKPILTILKGSVNEALVTGTYISQLADRSELNDDTSYTFYVSTFDWAGNETLTSLPNGTANTTINIKTSSTGQRIELNSDINQIRFYDSNDILVAQLGEDASSSEPQFFLNQDTNRDYIVHYRATDIDIAGGTLPTDTFYGVGRFLASNGGAVLTGQNDSNSGIVLEGIESASDDTTATNAVGATMIVGRYTNGSTVGALANDENILVVRNHSNTRAIFKGNGDLELDGTVTSTSYDLAEWMLAEQKPEGSVPIGLNLKTGKVREYQSGDELIGIHSLHPAFVANNNWESNKKDHIMVGLVGQFKDVKNVYIDDNNKVYTKDRAFRIGFKLANNRILLNIKELWKL